MVGIRIISFVGNHGSVFGLFFVFEVFLVFLQFWLASDAEHALDTTVITFKM